MLRSHLPQHLLNKHKDQWLVVADDREPEALDLKPKMLILPLN
jgi:hypothetical protein